MLGVVLRVVLEEVLGVLLLSCVGEELSSLRSPQIILYPWEIDDNGVFD